MLCPSWQVSHHRPAPVLSAPATRDKPRQELLQGTWSQGQAAELAAELWEPRASTALMPLP